MHANRGKSTFALWDPILEEFTSSGIYAYYSILSTAQDFIFTDAVYFSCAKE